MIVRQFFLVYELYSESERFRFYLSAGPWLIFQIYLIDCIIRTLLVNIMWANHLSGRQKQQSCICQDGRSSNHAYFCVENMLMRKLFSSFQLVRDWNTLKANINQVFNFDRLMRCRVVNGTLWKCNFVQCINQEKSSCELRNRNYGNVCIRFF